ncbi:MarR family transcriptional regulator [Actinosynnema sp. ALI-1.44]|uniref:MarR family winged helix-turn-helix transcriptional regulator n=1 Tax=Actinosynnema sp. ALI-1.44 TaxID=1933779 RepID=UPI00097BFD65|nr:MarR family winged helix-turn-helix transcriptional regulator [Actinosynnema sp. ALI-1.44]ONI83219.1 MarR family transcriptional regulator [Actinosynnema sp. ALI-1.44]
MDDGLADSLHRVVFLLGEVMRQRANPRGDLSYRQLRLLGMLEDIQPVTQHELAVALSVSDPAISRALRLLAAAGLVRIRTDPDHARRRLVSLTETGSKAFHDSERSLDGQLRDALLRAGFPYERYLADTARLAEFIDAVRD